MRVEDEIMEMKVADAVFEKSPVKKPKLRHNWNALENMDDTKLSVIALAKKLAKEWFQTLSPTAIWGLFLVLPSNTLKNWLNSLPEEDFASFEKVFYSNEVRKALQNSADNLPNATWEGWICDVGIALDGEDPLELVPIKHHASLRCMAAVGITPESMADSIDHCVKSGDWSSLTMF